MVVRVKKGLSSLLAFVLVLGVVFMGTPPSAYAVPALVSFEDGDGSSGNPYQIANAEQLNEVRNNLDKHFKLITEIDLTNYLAVGEAGYNGGAGWVPIGNSTTKFTGTFDGNGHTISGLMINNSTLDYAGLFGYTAAGSTIKNVGLVSINVTGKSHLGSLAGKNEGIIMNAYATGKVTSISGHHVGGLAGFNQGTITNSYAMVNVKGSSSIGGFVGQNGEYIPGFCIPMPPVGCMPVPPTLFPGIITNSYATGSVTGTGSAGGLVGLQQEGSTTTSSYYNTVTAQQNDTGKGNGKSTAEMQAQSTYTGWDFAGVWGIDTSGNAALHNSGYPYLRAIQSYLTYNGNGNTEGAVPFDSTSYFPGVTHTVNVLGQGDMTKSGYTFLGWNTAGTVSEAVYEAGDPFTITEDTTLYAVWTINQYTVRYDGNGSTGGTLPGSATQDYNTDITVSQNTGNIIKEGYSFAGWNTKEDGSGMSYDAGDSFTIPASDTTLYAQWLSSDAMLGGLSVSQGTLDFIPSDLNYTVDVDNEVTSLDVFITKGDPLQEMTVTGAVYQTVTDSVFHYEASDLVVGANPIHIQVSAQDGTQNQYNLTIQRLNNNADLSGLTLSSGTLNPEFAAAETSYTAEVSNSVDRLTVTPTFTDENASAAVSVNDRTAFPLANGTASEDLALTAGVNTIKVTVTAQDGMMTKTYTIDVTRATASSDDDASDDDSSGGGGGGTPSEQPDQNEFDLNVTIDGNTEQTIATATTSEQDGQTVLTAAVDTVKLAEQLEKAGEKPVVTIPVTTSADKVTAVLTGEAVKTMENKNAILEVQTPNGSYKLPASEVFIDQLSDQLGAGTNLENITLHVDIAKSNNQKIELLANTADKGGFTVVVPPVDFTVTATFENKTVQVTKFNAFVEREIPLPEDVDASKITTAVVLNEDGTIRSVPTKIVTRDGVTYAVINSLTNSTYSVAWNPVEFEDVEQHWSKDVVNDMGSRMVISGTGNGMFNPDQDITRAEFAAIIVRGLGLQMESGTNVSSDVETSAWYNSAVNTAYAYHLINGFEDGTFRPNDKITREQAMIIIAKAMEITKLEGLTSEQKAEKIFQQFTDAEEVSSWAKDGVADSVQAGIVSGRGNNNLAPKDFITRAEVAFIIERLLKKSELI